MPSSFLRNARPILRTVRVLDIMGRYGYKKDMAVVTGKRQPWRVYVEWTARRRVKQIEPLVGYTCCFGGRRGS